MGFNTAMVIRNDGLPDINTYATEFVAAIRDRVVNGGEIGVGAHVNVATVHAADHADAVQLIAVGGNYSTKVYVGPYTGPHHTKDGMEACCGNGPKLWASASSGRDVQDS